MDFSNLMQGALGSLIGGVVVALIAWFLVNKDKKEDQGTIRCEFHKEELTKFKEELIRLDERTKQHGISIEKMESTVERIFNKIDEMQKLLGRNV